MTGSAVMRGTNLRVELHPLGSAPTEREIETIAAYARLGDQQAVADHLRISVQTVKNHLFAIYSRLGVHSAIEAFHKLGWLRVPDAETRAADMAFSDAIAQLERLRSAIGELIAIMRTPGSEVGASSSGDPADELEQGLAATPASSLRRVV